MAKELVMKQGKCFLKPTIDSCSGRGCLRIDNPTGLSVTHNTLKINDMNKTSRMLLGLVAFLTAATSVQAQTISTEQQDAVQRIVAAKLPEHMGVGDLKVRSLAVENDTIKVDVSENFGDVPFTQEGVELMRDEIRQVMGSDYEDAPVLITIAGNDMLPLSLTTSGRTSPLSANSMPTATTSMAWMATSLRCGPAMAGISSLSSTAGSGSVRA